jgi:hypothetical protein
MGYETNFTGGFKLDKPLTIKMYTFIKKFSETRRMGRKIEGFGTEGEFFVDGKGFMGQNSDKTVIDGNKPPITQPSLWCQWTPNEEGTALEWDGGEKFYNYTEWIYYIINKILKPNGYVLNGSVKYNGENADDYGVISIIDNIVYLNGEVFDNPSKTELNRVNGEFKRVTIEDYMNLDVVFLENSITNKVAKLVYVSMVARVVVDEGATDEDILKASKVKFIDKVKTELNENLEEIVDDIECPV